MADHHSGGTSDDRGEDPHHEMSDDEVEMAADDEGTDQQHEMAGGSSEDRGEDPNHEMNSDRGTNTSDESAGEDVMNEDRANSVPSGDDTPEDPMNDAIKTRRACIIKALIVYLNEDPESLIREYLDVETDQSVDEMVLGIFAIKKEGAEPTDSLADVEIVIEGVEVQNDLQNIANALAILFGLTYALDLSYPKNLRCSFEVLQKILMEMEVRHLSTKAQVLKNKLNELFEHYKWNALKRHVGNLGAGVLSKYSEEILSMECY
ncbi:uncharacterized protein [Pseudochaenichthys georgianus]|uniref:uncharacterized protein isoform X1 n=2 Tax=Pseudochaenichthys georgianus TaxID=52239 RepID=UPI00146CE5B4|nr:uncharacterized protein LOC117461840 isoform X2 [Pseudochaenichthys georgianus]